MKKKASLFIICVLALIAVYLYVFTTFFKKSNNQLSCIDCNLIVMDIDVMRADLIDCENNPNNTPNICSLIDESQIFTNHHTHSELTRSGIGSFLTSTYPKSHGAWNELLILNDNLVTLPKILSENNFSTYNYGYFWKQEISKHYQKYFPIIEKIKMGKRFDNLEEPFFAFIYNSWLHEPYLSQDKNHVIDNPNKPEGFPNNAFEMEEARKKYVLDSYEEIFTQKAKEELFSKENVTDDEIYGYFQNSCDDPIKTRINESVFGCWRAHAIIFEKYINPGNKDHIDFIKYLYSQRMKDVDGLIGEIIEELKNKDLWNKTIFIIRSDHGEAFMDHGQLSHGQLYEEIIKTPLIIRIPNSKKITHNIYSQTIDEMPTILSIFNIDPPHTAQGRNLFSILKSKEKIENFGMAQFHMGGGGEITKEKYKLIINPDSFEVKFELYDLETDPFEKDNIARKNPLIVNDMYTEYSKFINTLPDYSLQQDILDKLSPDQRERMIREGYF